MEKQNNSLWDVKRNQNQSLETSNVKQAVNFHQKKRLVLL